MYWKHTNESGVQPLKVNLIIYENDLLQVKSDIIQNTIDHVTYFRLQGLVFTFGYWNATLEWLNWLTF